MNDIRLEKIKQIRSKTGCPLWAINACLELCDNNEDEAIEMLIDIYVNWGDHPERSRKAKEEKLRYAINRRRQAADRSQE